MGDTTVYILIVVLALLCLANVGLSVVLFKKLKNLSDTQRKLEIKFQGETVEELLFRDFEKQEQLSEEIHALKKSVRNLEDKQKNNFDNINVVRYSASRDGGTRMSYSVGISNDSDDGLVITGLHYNDGMNIYVKKVTDGTSDVPLSKEEENALKRSKIN